MLPAVDFRYLVEIRTEWNQAHVESESEIRTEWNQTGMESGQTKIRTGMESGQNGIKARVEQGQD